MCAVEGDEKNMKGGTRKELRKAKKERADIDRVLCKRGETKGEEQSIDLQLADILRKGRLQTQKQKAY